MSVLVLVEHDASGPIDGSLRALTFARAVGADPVAVLFGEVAPETMASLRVYGVSDAYVVAPRAVEGYVPLAWARVLAGLAGVGSGAGDEALGIGGGNGGEDVGGAGHISPVIAVLAAGTDHGNEVLAHLGAIAGLPMVANCFEVRAAGENGSGAGLHLSRQRWGGSLIEDAVLEASPAILTVATDAVPPVPAPVQSGEQSLPRVHEHIPILSPGDLALRAEESSEQAGGVSLASAKIVVSGGRGVGGPEGFLAVEELAALLGGAVGVSRVVTSLGWRPHTEQVGQTGTRVTPDLYLACGISGAIQHLAGCQSARHMVAINTDPDAPIMSRADYAVIGDVNAVLPALVAALRERKGSGATGTSG